MSFGSNKSKVHIVVDVNFNAIVCGVVTSTNVVFFGFIMLTSLGKKEFVGMKKK
jgi:hypothetical protein